MHLQWLFAVTAAVVVTAATIVALPDSAPSEAHDAAVPGSPAPVESLPSFLLDWKGFYRLGMADRFAHTYETEPLVAQMAKAGVRAKVSEGVSMLEFEVRWTGDADLHLMIHGPMKSDHSMPTYMAMGGDEDRICARIPVADVEPGVWEVMTHPSKSGPITVDFTISIRGEGTKEASLVSGPHGHPVAEDWSMDMRDNDKCAADVTPA